MGISYGSHDTGSCLIGDKSIIAAIEEERLNREKRTNKYPILSINYCLNKKGINLSDIEYLIVPQHPILLLKKAFFIQGRMLRKLSLSAFTYDLGLIWDMLNLSHKVSSSIKTNSKNLPKIRFVRHHSAHAASAFLVSPFDTAAILTIDGVGELETVTMSIGQENKFEKLRSYEFPFSVGKFYGSVCRYLGFFDASKEGKMMGLASYGDPSRYGPRMQKLIFFDQKSGDAYLDLSYFNLGWYPGHPSMVSEKFIKEFGTARCPEDPINQNHADIAAGAQVALEQAVFGMLKYLHKLTGQSNLCMAGGVALNSMLNGKIREKTLFKEIFVQPAANDAGLALGGALFYYNCELGNARIQPMTHPYFGPSYSDKKIHQFIKQTNFPFSISSDVAYDVAKLLNDGAIIGWFQGRAEIGPRALGSRSILADPREAKVRDIINAKIKHRESFRPFAPVVIEEEAFKYFKIDHPSPFMLEICEVHPEMISLIPAVTHVDGTARVQTINYNQNPLYYRLIKEFYKLTGIPVLLNTSFNSKGEPMVCNPYDALNCFKKNGLDYLIIGSYIVSKKQIP